MQINPTSRTLSNASEAIGGGGWHFAPAPSRSTKITVKNQLISIFLNFIMNKISHSLRSSSHYKLLKWSICGVNTKMTSEMVIAQLVDSQDILLIIIATTLRKQLETSKLLWSIAVKMKKISNFSRIDGFWTWELYLQALIVIMKC